MSKSEQIREMFSAGVQVSEIAKQLNINYAFAYQTCQRYAEKQGIEFKTGEKGESKASKIKAMYDQGMTIGEIAKELNSNYTFVWNTVDKHRKASR